LPSHLTYGAALISDSMAVSHCVTRCAFLLASLRLYHIILFADRGTRVRVAFTGLYSTAQQLGFNQHCPITSQTPCPLRHWATAIIRW